MILFRVLAAAALAFSSSAAAPSAAAPADAVSTSYTLVTPPSSFEVGCQGPCECAVASTPTYGSFVLTRTGADAVYTYYAVERYIASFNNGPGAVSILGSGQFRISEGAGAVQQMTLDLDIEGRPTQHYDSGLVPVRAAFPQLQVACAAHGFACFDSVVVVNAAPSEPVVVLPPSSPRAGLQAVRPNPFSGRTRISFALENPGRASLTIVDLEGRLVRRFAVTQAVGSGRQDVTWDGVRGDGRAARAGVYWVLLRWSGGVDRRRFVKLD